MPNTQDVTLMPPPNSEQSQPEDLQACLAIKALIEAIAHIKNGLLREESHCASLIAAVHYLHIKSAGNLIHYMALRKIDLQAIQEQLSALGLSSLGRAEGHVMATLNTVNLRLHDILKLPVARPLIDEALIVSYSEGKTLLAKNTENLFDKTPAKRITRIMVTMPTEAAYDVVFIENLLLSGMDCIRINCAHDNADIWLKIINNLRQAQATTQRPCRIAMDLAGPKLRTGPIKPSPPVLKIQPIRDRFGRVLKPAILWLKAINTEAPNGSQACLEVDEQWLKKLTLNARVHLTDARNTRRHFTVQDVHKNYCKVACYKTAYLMNGTQLSLSYKPMDDGSATKITSIPFQPQGITLTPNCMLYLKRTAVMGEPAAYDEAGQCVTEATIGCTLPEAFDALRVGDAIWFDDGKIGGTVEALEGDRAAIRIVQAKLTGDKLYADKGINLPGSPLNIKAITAKDADDLHFIVQHADIINFSFVNTLDDVNDLFNRMRVLTDRPIGVVLKIETQRAFKNLPLLLLATMRQRIIGVMIARGDLAVECGFARVAELQEEILWMCEAAHVPVIWATQVLEGLAKKGLVSRAEITDAAAGHRAECIMLNKGPHILDAVNSLNHLLERMQSNQYKKSPKLRPLNVAQLFDAQEAVLNNQP